MNVPHNLVKIDINEIKPSLVEYIQNEADNGVRVLDVMFLAQGRVIALGNDYTATATVSVNDALITDNLSCTVDSANNLVRAEIDCKQLQLTGSGVMKVQITVSDGTNILISPQPVLIRLTPDLAQTAQILPDSHSSYSEIVAEIVAARGDFDNLSEAIESKVSFVETTDPDTATDNGVWYKVRTNTENFALFAISTTAQQAQFRITSTGTIGIRRRYLSNGAFPAWGAFDKVGWKQSEIEDMIATYLASVKSQTITAQSTHDQIPTAKAVYDYAASKASYTYLNNQYIELENDVNQLPTVAEVQQMIDNSIGGVLSAEY